MNIKRVILIQLLAFSAISIQSQAQQTAIYTDPERDYKTGLELFDKEKYASAQVFFQKALGNPKVLSSEVKANSEYYAALCGLELTNKSSEKNLEEFIKKHPESPKAKQAYFRLGKFYFSQKKYKDAIASFNRTDLSFLSNDEAAEYYFKTGYSQLMTNDLTSAGKNFAELKSTNSKYSQAATFYYAHVQFQNKNYDAALKDFLKLKTNETYQNIVPYYIVQIYYLKGKPDSLLSFGTTALKSSNVQNKDEISYLVGNAYFQQSQFAEAIPYLEEHLKTAPKVKNEEIYQLGYAYYKSNNCNKAIEQFEKISPTKDSLGQATEYAIADCYLKTDKKSDARLAFQLASKMDFDKKIQEEALYNFAKISYDLKMFSEAIEAFQDYLKRYPQTNKADEINGLIADLYLYTKNYKEAIVYLENVQNKSEKTKAAYQKVAYYRGVELFNNSMFNDASSFFTKASKYPVDQKLEALSKYWLGEIAFRKNKFDEAQKYYNEFLYSPIAVNHELYSSANYNIGYCYFKQEDYNNALLWFRKFLKLSEESDKVRYNDALLRIADSYFVTRDYPTAQDYYQQVVKNHPGFADYGLFQQGMILGIQNKFNDKITILQQLIDAYPKSAYFDDALYESASAYLTLGESLQALNEYDEIVTKYPNSSYVKKALLGMALLYYNEKRDEKALETYKQVIDKYPATPEAREALTGIKNVYVNQGDAQGYLTYAAQVPFANISEMSQDSIMYEAAELSYQKGDCQNSIKSFTEYLSKYPNGYFSLSANFYKAECELKNKEYEKALEGYGFVTSKPKNTFTEKALYNSATIAFQLKDYAKALENYLNLIQQAEFKNNLLDAQAGAMRCALILSKYDMAAENAKLLINSEKASKELVIEAHLTFGRVLLAKDSLNPAQQEFNAAAVNLNSEKGAEAKYYVAFIDYLKNQNKESEKNIFELTKQSSSDYWIAKAYILLADVYLKNEDAFQAKATLQSIIDNYEGEDLKKEAQQKLSAITDKEKQKLEEEQKQKEEKKEKSEPVLDVETN